MSKILSILAVGLFVSASFATYAAHNPGGGGGGEHMGGMSSQHMSNEGLSNTNGPNAADRDKGQARAEDRRNQNAADNDKDQAKNSTQKKHKSKKHD